MPYRKRLEKTDMKIEELQPVAFPLANRFFKANGHKGKARGDERVFVLRDDNDAIKAALRACPRESGFLLRSVQVDCRDYRQGLGQLLVSETVKQLQPVSCWCYPHSHLQTFYEKNGFSLIDENKAPEEIRQPFIRYRQQGQTLLLMTTSRLP